MLGLISLSFYSTSCVRSHEDVWEDTKTASRHMGRGFRAMGGKHGDSRQIQSDIDFGPDEDFVVQDHENEFVPLQDREGNYMVAPDQARQPNETPGDPNSSIPGIEAFKDPSKDPALAGTFQNILFEYNSNQVKGDRNLGIIHNVADYMKSHSNTYIFVEGHCDERGPEAYNLALGARRSNAIRNMLIQEGVNPDHIFTISYGKERPLVAGVEESQWSLNRRGQFKIYQR